MVDNEKLDELEYYGRWASTKLRSYTPTNKKTMAFHKSTSKTRLLLGGKRSSKSTTAVVEVNWAALGIHPFLSYPPPPLQIRYCSVDFSSGVKGIVLPMFKEWIGSFDNGPIIKKYWSEDRLLEYHNDTIIDMKSYDQELEKFEGVARHLVVEDEIPPLDIHQSNFMRTISGGINGKLIITGTPLRGLDWCYDQLYDNPEAIPPAVEHWHIRTDENPYISADAIESIKADPSMKGNLEAALYGEFIPKSGLVFKSFSDKNVIDPIKLQNDHMILIGIDPHDRNPWGIPFIAFNRENEYIIYDEILQAGTVPELAGEINKKLKGRKPQLCVMDTSGNVVQATSGKSYKEMLMPYGLYCQDADKRVSEGILEVNSLLDLGKNKKPRLFITRNCVNTIRQVRHIIWEDWSRNRNQKDPKERILKRDDHIWDAIRYVCMIPLVYRSPGFRAVPRTPERVSRVTGYFHHKERTWQERNFLMNTPSI